MKRLLSLLMCCIIVFCGCQSNRDIPNDVSGSTGTSQQTPDSLQSAGDVIENAGSLYGSYLTMYSGSELDDSFPYIRLFHSYSDIEDYFYPSERYFMFGRRFTIACASFTDEFFKANDVMMLVISEPSTYVSHSLDSMSIADGKVYINLTRHIPENAPRSENIVYHLIFTAPRGSFDSIDTNSLELSITEVTDSENTDVFDAERYRYVYPEFWPATYSADAISDDPRAVIDSIESYDELLSFYESYKGVFDLDGQFLRYIGPVYDEAMFNDYILLLAVLPFDDRLPRPSVSDLFVYNLQIFITIDNLPEEALQEHTKWYLLAIAVSKNDLEGVNLTEFNIG